MTVHDYQEHTYPECSNPACQDSYQFKPGVDCEQSDFSHMCGARATHRRKAMRLADGVFQNGHYCEQHCLLVNDQWLVVECERLQYDPATVFAVLTQLDKLFRLVSFHEWYLCPVCGSKKYGFACCDPHQEWEEYW